MTAVWWCLGLATLLCALWGGYSVRKILYPERRSIPPPDPFPRHTRHLLTTPDGASFDVWRLQPSSPRARLLLYHGYYANPMQVIGIGEGLRAQGYEVLLFELRGHGNRPGPFTFGVHETRDAEAILQWARLGDAAADMPVGVLGLSMGGALACQLALRSPLVRAVVLDSVYARFFPVLCRHLRARYHVPSCPWAWLAWWSLQLALRARLAPRDPLTLAPRLRQPLFLIHGGRDPHVNLSCAEALYQRWAGSKERWIEPDVEHVGMFPSRPEEYGRRVAAFLDRAFAMASPCAPPRS